MNGLRSVSRMVKDRPDRQVALEIIKRLFDLDQFALLLSDLIAALSQRGSGQHPVR